MIAEANERCKMNFIPLLDGKVKEVTVKTGDTVESGQKMVVISKD